MMKIIALSFNSRTIERPLNDKETIIVTYKDNNDNNKQKKIKKQSPHDSLASWWGEPLC